MKISKLFHWLYASLMLLPLMVFGVTGLYYGLNQNAQLSETIEQKPVYYETNEVNSYTDLHTGNIYTWTNDFTPSGISNTLYFFEIEPTPNLETEFNVQNIAYGQFYMNTQGTMRLQLRDSNNTGLYDGNINGKHFDFVYKSSRTNIADLEPYISHFTSSSLLLVKEYLPITTTNDISTSIINAWNSTWQNPLFSWSSDSFLIAPFNYITDLFSIPQNNTFSMALSYWLSISIVYLVFDLVMYVPLLAHRWIDKGMVE